MSVYIDSANILWRGKRWCHLYADSLAELVTFADKIGLKRAWLQFGSHGDGFPHFDVTGVILDRCLTEGAILVTRDNDPYRGLRRAHVRGEYPMLMPAERGHEPGDGDG